MRGLTRNSQTTILIEGGDLMNPRIFSILLVTLACFLVGGSLGAQDKYPEKPIQSLIPYNPGGSTDLYVRALTESMSKYLGQPVIPVNKPGAGGSIAGAALVNSKPDGYTIAHLNPSQTHPELMVYFKPAPYTSKDLQFVANWGYYQFGLVVRSDSPWVSLKEFVEYARNNPGKIRCGNSGTGGRFWITAMSFVKQTGINIKDIPFQGDVETMTALLGNHIEMGIVTFWGGVLQQIEAKKIRPLCSFTEKRLEELPGVPTIKELGYQYREGLGVSYLGTFLPKGTPPNITAKISEAIRKTTEDTAFKAKMKKLGCPIWYLGTKDFEEYDARDAKLIEALFKEMGYL